MLDNLLIGLTTALTFNNLLYCALGAFIGTAIGVLPGIGPIATISILLPFVYSLNDPMASIIALAGIYYGAQYGGSTSAILFKMPGEISSVVTTLDGYQLGKKGRAGQALSIAALSSFVAGIFATILVFFFSEPIAAFAIKFGPVDYTILMMLGLFMSVAFNGSFVKGMLMLTLGIMLGLVGLDTNSGVSRFTFGILDLQDGMSFVLIAMGMIGLSEILYNFITGAFRFKKQKLDLDLYPNKQELLDSIPATARGTITGSILGMIPGAGSLLGPLFAYSMEKIFSRNRNKLGTGIVEGVAAPEAANNAAAQTGFIPLMSLGVPFTPIMSLMLAALIINGLYPGPAFIQSNQTLFYGFVISMVLGNIILLLLNLPLIRLWISLLYIPNFILYPSVIVACLTGAYYIHNNVFDVMLLIPFTLAGLIFRFLDFQIIPLAMGFVCGKMFEEYLRRSLIISEGSFLPFLHSPMLIFSIVVVGIYFYTRRFKMQNTTS